MLYVLLGVPHLIFIVTEMLSTLDTLISFIQLIIKTQRELSNMFKMRKPGLKYEIDFKVCSLLIVNSSPIRKSTLGLHEN